MSNFICSYIEYCPARNCELENDIIVAKSGSSFVQVDAANVVQFRQAQKNSDGNPYFEQSLSVNTLNDMSALIYDELIINLYLPDGTKKQWGSLAPFNPVMAVMEKINSEYSVSFVRYAVTPL